MLAKFFASKFQAFAEKMQKSSEGYFFAAPCSAFHFLNCAFQSLSVNLHLRDGRTDGQTPGIEFGAS